VWRSNAGHTGLIVSWGVASIPRQAPAALQSKRPSVCAERTHDPRTAYPLRLRRPPGTAFHPVLPPFDRYTGMQGEGWLSSRSVCLRPVVRSEGCSLLLLYGHFTSAPIILTARDCGPEAAGKGPRAAIAACSRKLLNEPVPSPSNHPSW